MTDSFKRESCSQRLQAATPQVVQFLLNLQCPTLQARRKAPWRKDELLCIAYHILHSLFSWSLFFLFLLFWLFTIVINTSLLMFYIMIIVTIVTVIVRIRIALAEVLECFLSWIKYTNLQAADIAQNPLIPECFKHVVDGADLSETATDIIVEVLRMCSADISMYQPVIEVILNQLDPLRWGGLLEGLARVCQLVLSIMETLQQQKTILGRFFGFWRVESAGANLRRSLTEGLRPPWRTADRLHCFGGD